MRTFLALIAIKLIIKVHWFLGYLGNRFTFYLARYLHKLANFLLKGSNLFRHLANAVPDVDNFPIKIRTVKKSLNDV